jgi:hypothetical protein
MKNLILAIALSFALAVILIAMTTLYSGLAMAAA